MAEQPKQRFDKLLNDVIGLLEASEGASAAWLRMHGSLIDRMMVFVKERKLPSEEEMEGFEREYARLKRDRTAYILGSRGEAFEYSRIEPEKPVLEAEKTLAVNQTPEDPAQQTTRGLVVFPIPSVVEGNVIKKYDPKTKVGTEGYVPLHGNGSPHYACDTYTQVTSTYEAWLRDTGKTDSSGEPILVPLVSPSGEALKPRKGQKVVRKVKMLVGTDLVAAAYGTAVFTPNDIGGNVITHFWHDETGRKHRTQYRHLNSVDKKFLERDEKGRYKEVTVYAGEKIGVVGTTGNAAVVVSAPDLCMQDKVLAKGTWVPINFMSMFYVLSYAPPPVKMNIAKEKTPEKEKARIGNQK